MTTFKHKKLVINCNDSHTAIYDWAVGKSFGSTLGKKVSIADLPSIRESGYTRLVFTAPNKSSYLDLEDDNGPTTSATSLCAYSNTPAIQITEEVLQSWNGKRRGSFRPRIRTL